MGTDINAFIEIDTTGKFTDASCICSLTRGSFFLDRDYSVFDALAGAREDQMPPEERDPSRLPLIPPRGMPAPRSLSVSQAFYFIIDDPVGTIGAPDHSFWPSHRCVAPIDAAEWSRKSHSVTSTVVQWFNGDHLWDAISPPGVFYPTWFTYDEFVQSLLLQGIKTDELSISYRILSKAFEMAWAEYGAECVRLIVWFDN